MLRFGLAALAEGALNLALLDKCFYRKMLSSKRCKWMIDCRLHCAGGGL
jgi:hypothetical protein